MRRLLLLPGALVLLVACSSAPSGTAASFNDVRISNRSFERELTALKNNQPLAEVTKQGGFEVAPNGTINPELAAQWLAADIEQIPVDQEFERRNLTVTPEQRELAKQHAAEQLAGSQGGDGQKVLDAFPTWFQDLVIDRQARVEAVINAFVADDGFADDAAWAAANPQAIAEYCASGKVVRHILVKNRDEATAAQAELAAGRDFAAVAAEKSTDPGSKNDGGALGCAENGQFVAPFEAAMNATAPGTVSEPVQTEYGFHLIRVDTLDATSSPAVITGLRQAAAGRRFSAWLDEQMSAATIVIDPKWGTAGTSAGRFRITAPTTTTSAPKSTPTSAPGSIPTSAVSPGASTPR